MSARNVRTAAAALMASPLAALVLAAPAQASRPDIVLPLGQTTVLSIQNGVSRIVVGDSKVADVVLLEGQTRDILVNAKAPGFTNFLIFPLRGSVLNYRLEVLSTTRDETLAVRVQVLEVTERRQGNVGVRWQDSLGLAEAVPNAPFRIGNPIRTSVLTAAIQTLAQDRDIRILANPTLVVQNGKTAEFLSGGELPIPMLQPSGNTAAYTIEWKPFGIKLKVTPRLEGYDTILLNLRPEVSVVDQENSVNLNNLRVPAIATRFVDTQVQIKAGESLVLAGLMRQEKTRVAAKLPWLGDVPILGYLFGAAEYDERSSELVFVVTPSVVQNNQVLPERNYGTGRPGQRR